MTYWPGHGSGRKRNASRWKATHFQNDSGRRCELSASWLPPSGVSVAGLIGRFTGFDAARSKWFQDLCWPVPGQRGHPVRCREWPSTGARSCRADTLPAGGAVGVHCGSADAPPRRVPTMKPVKPAPSLAADEAPRTSRETLSITDNRTGKQYELHIKNGTIRALDLRQIKTDGSDFGLMSYDPAFNNTALCNSRVTFIDGDVGILRYRGYPIEELAEKSNYLETAYLILRGDLPSRAQLDEWSYHITHHTFIHESIKKFLDGFHYDAHPMGMMISTMAALSTFYPDAKEIFNQESRLKQTWLLIGKMPTLAAFAYRHSLGMPYAYPDNELSYTGNFLNMLFKTTELKYRPNPTLEHALDVLFILHADHEQNCSATAMRNVGSSHVDPYSATAAATAALYGPLHGGANEQVLRMLMEIGSVARVPEYIKRVKAGETKLMGFGHRIYKNY